jgi:hypothetical protein
MLTSPFYLQYILFIIKFIVFLYVKISNIKQNSYQKIQISLFVHIVKYYCFNRFIKLIKV